MFNCRPTSATITLDAHLQREGRMTEANDEIAQRKKQLISAKAEDRNRMNHT